MSVERDSGLVLYFHVDFGDNLTGYFTDVSGISIEREVVSHEIVTDSGETVIRRMPGRSTAGEVTLKRAVTKNMDAWTWRQKVVDGQIKAARCAGTMTAFDQEMTPMAVWNVTDAWPSKISTSSPDSASQDVVTEEITIVFETLERAQ